MPDYMDDIRITNEIEKDLEERDRGKNKKLFDRLGGRPRIAEVHKIFYDKIFSDAWLSQFFQGISQEHLENQQSDFMMMLFGGPKVYSGRMPIDAHEHVMITEEMFDYRSKLLAESLDEAGIPEPEKIDWLRVDSAFKKVITKQSVGDCKKRFATDTILDFPCPAHLDVNKKAS